MKIPVSTDNDSDDTEGPGAMVETSVQPALGRFEDRDANATIRHTDGD